MTGATMTRFTPEAEARLEDYLTRVRAALVRSPEVNPDEVEADIREHVAAEFRHAPGLVTLPALEAVLTRLGPPDMWAPAGATARTPLFDLKAAKEAAKRRYRDTIDTLYRGPEDWRLAYLTVGLFAFGLLTAPIVIGALFLGMSYFFARAAIALAHEKNAPLGARRWLVYPPVLLVSVPLFLGVMLWPIAAAPIVNEELVHPAGMYREYVASVDTDGKVTFKTDPERRDAKGRVTIHPSESFYRIFDVYRDRGEWKIRDADRRRHEATLAAMDRIPLPAGELPGVALAGFAAKGALLAWWAVVGLTVWFFPRWPAAVFCPLFGRGDGSRGGRLFAFAAIGVVIWAGFAWQLLEAAGVG